MVPNTVGQMFRMSMPQEAKPTVSIMARVATLLSSARKMRYSPKQARVTRPMLKKVAL